MEQFKEKRDGIKKDFLQLVFITMIWIGVLYCLQISAIVFLVMILAFVVPAYLLCDEAFNVFYIGTILCAILVLFLSIYQGLKQYLQVFNVLLSIVALTLLLAFTTAWLCMWNYRRVTKLASCNICESRADVGKVIGQLSVKCDTYSTVTGICALPMHLYAYSELKEYVSNVRAFSFLIIMTVSVFLINMIYQQSCKKAVRVVMRQGEW